MRPHPQWGCLDKPSIRLRRAPCPAPGHLIMPRITPIHWRQLPPQNCPKNLTSFSTKCRISSIAYFLIAIRSIPNPNAHPEYSSGSTLHAFRTFGCTIPHPPSSIHRCLSSNQTSTSAEGSVNGKKLGRNLTFVFCPKYACTN